jgi:hypothetical protein
MPLLRYSYAYFALVSCGAKMPMEQQSVAGHHA